MPEQPSIIDDVLIFVLGIVLPFISGVRSQEGLKGIIFTRSVRQRFYISNSLVLWAAAIAIMGYWALMGRPFSAMGLRPNTGSHILLAWRLALLVTILYVSDVVFSMRNEKALEETISDQDDHTPFLPHSFREFPAYVFMCLSAGIGEEILYRGYMVTYFLPRGTDAFPWMALLFPALLFSLAHYYQGWHAVIKIYVLSLLLAGIYLASGSLWIGMALHFLIDLTGGILAVLLKRKA